MHGSSSASCRQRSRDCSRRTPIEALPARPRRLRVASWNIQACRRGIAGVAQLIASLGVDLIALQEVERGTRAGGGVNQADFLARAAGFAHVFFLPTLERDGGDYGIALLSRLPICPRPPLALPTPAHGEARLLGLACLASKALPWGCVTDRLLTVAFTHLSHRPDRALIRWRQARAIVEALRVESPCLLLGDFNGLPGTAMHRTLSAHFCDMFASVGRGRGATHTPLGACLPGLRIDFLFTSAAIRPRSARVVETAASDHHALVGDIELVNATNG